MSYGFYFPVLSSFHVLVSELLAYEYDDMPSGRMAHALDGDIITDAVGRFAVMACTVLGARRVEVEPCHVRWSRDTPRPLYGRIDIPAYLVQSDDEDDVLRSPGDSCHAVAVAVDVDDHAVLGDRVHACEIVVTVERLQIGTSLDRKSVV